MQPTRTVQRKSSCACSSCLLNVPVAVASQKIAHLAVGFLLCHSAALLGLAETLVASAGGRSQRIAGQLTPGFVHPSGNLQADASESFPVHTNLPLRLMRQDGAHAYTAHPDPRAAHSLYANAHRNSCGVAHEISNPARLGFKRPSQGTGALGAGHEGWDAGYVR